MSIFVKISIFFDAQTDAQWSTILIERGDSMLDEVYDMGMLLRKLRKQKKLSQHNVASHLNISRSTLASYEANTSIPSIDVLKAIAVFYRISTDYLLGLEKSNFISLKNLSETECEAVFKIVDAIADLSQSNLN